MANDAVRRIMAEVKEFSTLNNSPSSFFHAQPLESDLFEWHFTVRGPPDTAFAHGVYHGRILLPAEYPLKPPEIILLTPNGRFEVGKRICLSVTAHHQETWQPSWGIRTILTALVGFMPSKAEGVGALDYPDEDRRGLARKSHGFRCERCGALPVEQLPPREPTPSTSDASASGGDSPSVDSTVQDASQGVVTCVLGETIESSKSPTKAKPPEEALQPESSAPIDHTTESIPNGIMAEAQQSIAPSSAVGPSPTLTTETYRPELATEPEPDQIDEITPQSTATNAVPNGTVRQRVFMEPPATVPDVAEDPGITHRPETQERELLYVAYAIVLLMVAIIARRVVKIVIE